jgi:Dolichyl-phosphate-mannose-protein mannosyltransferase
VLAVIVVASALFCALYFLQLNATPLVALHRVEQTDMHYYHEWGRRVSEGDWLSVSVDVPMHPWQYDVAAQYFSDHPDARADPADAGSPGPHPDPAAQLWSRWMGGEQFYQDPLYSYLIGLTYRVTGPDPRAVFAWQMGLGVLSNVLIWLLARRFFGDLTAACAAALAVLCAPLMYYELILLRESTIAFAGLAITWLVQRALDERRWQWFLGLGLTLGLSMMLKSTFALIALGVAAAVLVLYRRDRRTLRLTAVGVAAGILIAMAPLVVRNVSLGVRPFALASSGPLTFALSNDVDYPVEAGFYVDILELSRVMGAADGRAIPALVETLRSHTATSFLSLVWRKFAYVWHWYEIPNNDNFSYMRLRAPVLAWLPVTAWLIVPLGLMGLVIPGRPRSTLWPLYLLVAVSLAPMVIFYVLGRFRVPLLAALIPFAATALVQLVAWIRAGHVFRVLATAGALAALIAGWTGRPLSANEAPIRPTDWLLPYIIQYQADVERAAGDPAKVAAAYLAFFEYEPDAAQIREMGTPELARSLAELHRRCAVALGQLGRTEAAAAQMAEMKRLLDLAEGS